MSLCDLIKAELVAAGESADSVQDCMKSRLQAISGSSSHNMNQLLKAWLTGEGATANDLNQQMFDYLGAKGYTQTGLKQRIYAAAVAGELFSSGGAAPAVPSPPGFTGEKLAWRINTTAGLYQAASKTTPVTADAQPVMEATQSVTGTGSDELDCSAETRRPEYDSSGNGSLIFNGSNQNIRGHFTSLGSGEITIAVRAKFNTAPNTGDMLWSMDNSLAKLFYSGGKLYHMFQIAGTSVDVKTDGTEFVHIYTFDGTSTHKYYIYEGGTLIDSNTQILPNNYNSNRTKITLMGDDGETNFVAGQGYAIYVLDGDALAGSELTTLDNWMRDV